jgi:hypothetical protein
MTLVIRTTGRGAYPAGMTSASPAEIQRLMQLQEKLAERTSGLDASAAEVLEVGAAVLEFAEREESAFFPLLPLLDPAARAELGDEHEQLAEDLQLLEWLISTTPDSPDVGTLAEAIARRMRGRIARDGRLLAQAARMAAL